MAKIVQVDSLQELKETLVRAEYKKRVRKKTIHVHLEDYVSAENGDFLHEPYISFSAVAKHPRSNKNIVYLYRERLWPGDHLPFGKYSLRELETDSKRSFVNGIVKKAQEMLNPYLTLNESSGRYLIRFEYEMHTEEIIVRMKKPESKASSRRGPGLHK
jgi:hypothetical protein